MFSGSPASPKICRELSVGDACPLKVIIIIVFA
jgi:hypothetical protein